MSEPFRTRTFRYGNSVAVRLPREFEIPEGKEVVLEKKGDSVILRLADRQG